MADLKAQEVNLDDTGVTEMNAKKQLIACLDYTILSPEQSLSISHHGRPIRYSQPQEQEVT